MRITKRCLDLSLIALSAPFVSIALGALAMAVVLLDGRPVFFVQPRLGRGRKPFNIWKLRTMSTERDPRDRRPTRLGNWLRHRGLDELPQLFNVATGQMSLVGPRPLCRDDADRLTAQYPAFERRFEVAPGITGLAQLSGARGAEVTAQLDGDYARACGVWLDLRILIWTLWINVVGKSRGYRALRLGAPKR
jgi:lipopolysaccharide/colanic/teichoic acid biosynthesis glycosyltransferase